MLFSYGISNALPNANQEKTKQYYLQGKISDKIVAKVWFERREDGLTVGNAVYTNTTEPIRLIGTITDSEEKPGSQTVFLKEYMPDGKSKGLFSGYLTNGKFTGEWMNYVGDSYPCKLHKSLPLPGWSLFSRETDLSKIDGSYSYSYNLLKDKGGHAVIKTDDNGNVKFKISVLDPNIADTSGAEGAVNGWCTAKLHGNKFRYLLKYSSEDDDPGYEFETEFFPGFMRVVRVAGPEQYEGFGAHTTLENVYVKVSDNMK